MDNELVGHLGNTVEGATPESFRAWGRKGGLWRYEHHPGFHKYDRKKVTGDPWKNEVVGYCGELAIHWHTGQRMMSDFKEKPDRFGCDVGVWQVKARP